MSQISICDLSPPVEAHLRERARIEGRSLSAVASEILSEAIGIGGEGERRDLSAFLGLWTKEEALKFEASQEIFEKVDEETWR